MAASKDEEEDTAAPLVPDTRDLDALRAAAAKCSACDLGPKATQTVFGEGARHARICLIGEQPGDEEDLTGKPFVGPAGRVLDRALADAGVQRTQVYVTNAVKHFSFRPMGKKKRLHQRPNPQEIRACRPWLVAELDALRPDVIVCLGAIAAQSFMGRRFALTHHFGSVFETQWAKALIVTYHPSAILRMPEGADRKLGYEQLVADLRRAAELTPLAPRARK